MLSSLRLPPSDLRRPRRLLSPCVALAVVLDSTWWEQIHPQETGPRIRALSGAIKVLERFSLEGISDGGRALVEPALEAVSELKERFEQIPLPEAAERQRGRLLPILLTCERDLEVLAVNLPPPAPAGPPVSEEPTPAPTESPSDDPESVPAPVVAHDAGPGVETPVERAPAPVSRDSSRTDHGAPSSSAPPSDGMADYLGWRAEHWFKRVEPYESLPNSRNFPPWKNLRKRWTEARAASASDRVAKFEALLQDAERWARSKGNQLWLTGTFYVIDALQELGHLSTQRALEVLMEGLLRAHPELRDLSLHASDLGVLDPEVQLIDPAFASRIAPTAASSASADETDQDLKATVGEALAKGIASGLRAAEQEVAKASSPRQRFLRLLTIAELLAAGASTSAAVRIAEALKVHAAERGLREWEPALVLRVNALLLRTTTKSPATPDPTQRIVSESILLGNLAIPQLLTTKG